MCPPFDTCALAKSITTPATKTCYAYECAEIEIVIVITNTKSTTRVRVRVHMNPKESEMNDGEKGREENMRMNMIYQRKKSAISFLLPQMG